MTRTVGGASDGALRVVGLTGAVVLVAGGVAWCATFIRFAREHPGLDGEPWLWLVVAAALIGVGMLLMIVAGWRPAATGFARVAAITVALGALAAVPPLALVAVLAVVAGMPLLGVALVRASRRTLGLLLCLVGFAFVATRLWMLGPRPEETAMASVQDGVEIALAIAVAGAWVALAITSAMDLLGSRATTSHR